MISVKLFSLNTYGAILTTIILPFLFAVLYHFSSPIILILTWPYWPQIYMSLKLLFHKIHEISVHKYLNNPSSDTHPPLGWSVDPLSLGPLPVQTCLSSHLWFHSLNLWPSPCYLCLSPCVSPYLSFLLNGVSSLAFLSYHWLTELLLWGHWLLFQLFLILLFSVDLQQF